MPRIRGDLRIGVMFRFLRKTALWIMLSPLTLGFLGVASNQVVLTANHDRFPVMWNTYKAAKLEMEIEKAGKKAVKDAEAAAADGDEDAEAAAVDKVDQAEFDLEALENAGYLDDTHVLMSKDTHFNFLADWIDTHDATYSLGDVAQYAGFGALPYSPFIWGTVVIGKLNKREEREY